MRRLGFEPDPWQLDVLQARHRRLLLNCSRQAGKSTVSAGDKGRRPPGLSERISE